MADRLLYGTPTGKHPHVGFVSSMRVVERSIRSFKIEDEDQCFTVGPVQMARSQLAERALDQDYDFLLMHDDDLVIGPPQKVDDPMSPWHVIGNPVDVWHELMVADSTIGMIGAVYMREKPLMPNVVIRHPQHPEELCHVMAGFPNAAVEVGGVGTGFVLVRVAAMRAIARAELEDGCPPMFRFPMTVTRYGLVEQTGEDYDFCQRLHAAGYKVVADPRYRTQHMKDRGALHWHRESWEKSWETIDDPANTIGRELRMAFPPTFEIKPMHGFLAVDRTAQTEIEAKAWRQKLQERAREREREAA